MSELIGLAYYAEIPAVIVDVQRTGPSTGMPTRTQQGDLLLCAYASHGDTKHILLFPANPEECFEFAVEAFDLAERFQTPVFVLSDLDIGMNDWVCPRLNWDDALPPRPRRGARRRRARGDAEVLPLPDRGRATASRRARCPACTPKGAFFTRGSGHNKLGGYTEIPDEYQEVIDRLAAQAQRPRAEAVPAPIIERRPARTLGIVTVGGCDRGRARGARRARPSAASIADYMRVRGFPFDDEVEDVPRARTSASSSSSRTATRSCARC